MEVAGPPIGKDMLPQKLGLGSQAALVISHPSARMGRCSETEQEPVEASRVQEPFHVSHFLPIEKGFPPPRPSLSSKGQIHFFVPPFLQLGNGQQQDCPKPAM